MASTHALILRTITGTTLAECEAQLRDGERIVRTSGSRVTGSVVCQVEPLAYEVMS